MLGDYEVRKPSWFPKLPKNYDNTAYIRAFKLLDPPMVPNVNQYSSDKEVVYWVHKAFEEYVTKQLVPIDYARQLGPKNWMITIYGRIIFVKMNILPILLYSGFKISFVDFDPVYK